MSNRGHLPVRVMIVEDQAMFVHALRALLERDGRIEVVATADNGAAALELAIEREPDVALVDIAMPGIDGIETTRRLRTVRPRLHVFVLSGATGKTAVRAATNAGASGFLLKGDLHHEIADAIVDAARGDGHAR